MGEYTAAVTAVFTCWRKWLQIEEQPENALEQTSGLTQPQVNVVESCPSK